MKLALLLPLPLLLAACATKPVRSVEISPRTVPGTTLPGEGIESVRYAESIKTYPMGRYVDPNNARIMHEGHRIYRVETTAKWNLHPNEPVVVPLGPVAHVRDSARATAPVGDELVAQMNQQKEATKAILQGGQAVSQKLGELAGKLQQTQELAAQNTQLKQEMNTARQRLDALEESLRQQQRAARTGPPTNGPKDEKTDW